MTDNPYINQDDWGRDLLRRLGNLSEEDGSLNSWNDYPTVGKDGDPLGPQHTGYFGIVNTEGKSKFIKWDGTSWEAVLQIPFFVEGDNDTKAIIVNKESSNALTAYDEGPSSEHFFITEAGSSSAISLYSKNSGIEIWKSVVNLLPEYGSSFRCQVIFTDAERIYVEILEEGHSSLARDIGLCAFQRSTGHLLWRVSLFKHSTGFVWGATKSSSGFLFIPAYNINTVFKVNSINGVAENLSFSPLSISHDSRRIFYAPLTDTLLFYEERNNTARVSKRSPANFDSISASPVFDTAGWVRDLVFAEGDDAFAWSYVNNKFILNKYSAGTNNFVPLAEMDDISIFGDAPNLLGARFIANKIYYLVGTSGGSRLITLTLGATPQLVEVSQSNFQSEGQGPPPPTVLKRFTIESSDPNIFFLRNLLERKGRSSESLFALSVWASQEPSNTTAFDNSFVKYNDAPIEEDINAFSIFATRGKFDLASAKTFYSPGSNPPASLGGIREEWPGAGFHVGHMNGGVQIFDVYGDYGTFASKSYAGGGGRVGGISFRSSLVNSVLHRHNPEHRSGIFCYDVNLNKFFLECRTTNFPNAEITDFPNGSGLVLATNKLGINTQSPAYPVDVTGTLRATTLIHSGGTVTSDERIKVGILALDGLGLWEICKELAPISYLYKPDVIVETEEISKDEDGNEVRTKITQAWPMPQKIQYGWSAQQIREYLPELVSEDPQSGILYLNREALSPIFQSAATAKIKQLEESIAQKDTLLTQLQSALESLTTRVEALENAAA